MIAQSLAACAHTVPDGAVPSSIHVDLLRTGESGEPVDFRVERVRDGGSLQHRDVRGFQGDSLIVHATVVSAVPAAGLDWQRHPIPAIAPPDLSPGAPEAMGHFLRWGVFDVGYPTSEDDAEPPSHPLWVRSSVELPDDPWLEGAVRAFWSDFGMNWSARATHNELDEAPVVSLSSSHSVWFHRWPAVHEWHLFDVHTQSLAGNQGFVQASLFDASGGLTASVAQGVYIRNPGPA